MIKIAKCCLLNADHRRKGPRGKKLLEMGVFLKVNKSSWLL